MEGDSKDSVRQNRNIQRALQENGIRQGIQIYRKDMRRKSSCNSCTVSQSCRAAGFMRVCGRSRIEKRTARVGKEEFFLKKNKKQYQKSPSEKKGFYYGGTSKAKRKNRR